MKLLSATAARTLPRKGLQYNIVDYQLGTKKIHTCLSDLWARGFQVPSKESKCQDCLLPDSSKLPVIPCPAPNFVPSSADTLCSVPYAYLSHKARGNVLGFVV